MLTVLIIDENPVRAAILEEGLREAGYDNLKFIDRMDQLLDRVLAVDPDVIVIDLENPNRDVLEQMFQVSREIKRPVAMFVDQSDSSMIGEAVEAGVSTYVVDGLHKQRIRPIVDVTVSRFNAFMRLREELAEAKSALQDRKIIEKAKGILMRQRNMTEDEAYKALRSTAMNHKKKVAAIAETVVTAAQLLE